MLARLMTLLAPSTILFVITANAAIAQSDLWQVGIAKKDISPKEKIWLAGYAAREAPMQDILHPIWAKALVVKGAAGKIGILISTDLLGFPKTISDTIRSRITRKWNIDVSQVILNSSHTHSAPVLSGALSDIYPIDEEEISKIVNYSEQIILDILFLVDDAMGNLSPAEISSGLGYTRFQVNRRNNDENKAHLLSELRGPHDPAVSVLKIADEEKKLIGVVFSYACHPTVLDTNLLSGDYPGFAQLELEKNHPGVTAFFIQGAGGDQNPMPRLTIPLARQYGRTLAAAVERVLEEPMQSIGASLTTSYSDISLDLNAPPTTEQLTEHCEIASGYLKRWGERLLREGEQGKAQPRQYPYPVQVWRLGQQMIVALGGELVSGYAVNLKKIFGHQIFVFGYCNDVMSYIPTSKILTEGGYEGRLAQSVYGLPSTWSLTIETKIMAEVIRQAKILGINPMSYPLVLGARNK